MFYKNDYSRCAGWLGIFLLGSILFSSCARYKQIAYFKDIPDSAAVYQQGVQTGKASFAGLKIRPGDILQISIQTIDPTTNNIPGTQTGFTTSDWVSQQSQAVQGNNNLPEIPGYMVDNSGYIELPLVGKIEMKGLTVTEAKEQIRQRATRYYKDPVVNVRIANFKVTVLGEVMRPGTYVMDEEKATLLDALGMAGDMTIFGKRKNVLLSREGADGKEKLVRFDLNSKDIFQSPYFYLQQGDVVYVEPGKGKAAANDAAAARIYTIVASTVSLLIVVATRVKF